MTNIDNELSSHETHREFLHSGAEQAAKLLRALGNEHRLLVLCLLIEHGEMSAGSLHAHTSLSQSAFSQHLAKMRDEGLIAFRREAQTLHYRIANANVARLIATLKSIYCP